MTAYHKDYLAEGDSEEIRDYLFGDLEHDPVFAEDIPWLMR